MTETNENTVTVKESTMNALHETFWKLNAIVNSLNLVAYEKNEGDPEADKVELLQLSIVACDYMKKLDKLFDQADDDNTALIHEKAADPERNRATEA